MNEFNSSAFRDAVKNLVEHYMNSGAVKEALKLPFSHRVGVSARANNSAPEGALASLRVDVQSQNAFSPVTWPNAEHGHFVFTIFPHCTTGHFSQSGCNGAIFALGQLKAGMFDGIKKPTDKDFSLVAQEFQDHVISRVIKGIKDGVFKPTLKIA